MAPQIDKQCQGGAKKKFGRTDKSPFEGLVLFVLGPGFFKPYLSYG
jgi:hypothetical protein